MSQKHYEFQAQIEPVPDKGDGYAQVVPMIYAKSSAKGE